MRLVMIGTGYVGLVTGTCFAESGNDVICLDVDRSKIDGLRAGEIPIYEPGLTELVTRNADAGRLRFTTSYAEAIPQAECVFICVGTPQSDDGAADLKYVESACRDMAPHLPDGAVVVVKSTVPVGTNRKVAGWIREGTDRAVQFASNPEFLKEGAAIDDFTKPDRVVVGVDDRRTADVLQELYKPFLRNENPFLVMGIESAEMTKYVANALLATKISFINETANLCERVGADVNDVRRGIGHDKRIGFAFLYPGVGYGGSCFPKDVRAEIRLGAEHGCDLRILKAVDAVNDAQKEVLYHKLKAHFSGGLAGRTIAVWGLSFKPRTDDIREAPALVLIDRLLAAGAQVRVHDPVAEANVRRTYGERLVYSHDRYEVLDGADALAICTEWNEFRNPDFDYMKSRMKQPVIFDGRNLYDPRKLAALGFLYSGIGLKGPAA
ncbi:MAG TPA: UDP-glucose/GDP-mannose dehydrogenase family protein [Planctomycetaceae bacterium]|nr:UDP-glucose/GDP-mannose dehydrogenase family protein [Planctomycetaceae bacterium]